MGDTPDSDTMDSDTECTARGRPSLSLLLMPTTWADMDSDTMDSDTPVSDTTDSDTPDSDTMDSDTECTARGRPRLSLRLLLILTTDTDILVSDTPDTVTDTVSDTPDTVTDTTVTDTVTDTDTTATSDKLHQDLSVNQQLKCGQKWILSV